MGLEVRLNNIQIRTALNGDEEEDYDLDNGWTFVALAL